MKKEDKNKVKKRVFYKSIIALICFVLTFAVHWIFILPVAVILWMNQKDLLGN